MIMNNKELLRNQAKSDICRGLLIMIGMLAGSKAGHDKGMVYVIIKEEAEYVYLADGSSKTLCKPKKKNKKHIQIIKKHSEPELAVRIQEGRIDDIEIRRIIRQYETSIITGENRR